MVCKFCEKEFPLDQFPNYRADSQKPSRKCVGCIKEYKRQWHLARVAVVLPAGFTKTCSVCEKTFPASGFYRHKGGAFGLAARCRKCTNIAGAEFQRKNKEQTLERIRRWIERNPERRREIAREWNSRNKHLRPKRDRSGDLSLKIRRKILKAQPKISPVTLKRIFESTNGKCSYCGIAAKLTLDHMIPLSKGGLHNAKNLSPVCQPCNSSKRNKTLEEYRAWCGKIGRPLVI